MNFKHASSCRALASPTRLIAPGRPSSIRRSIWSSSFSQSLIARKAMRELLARKSRTLNTESRATPQARSTRSVSSLLAISADLVRPARSEDEDRDGAAARLTFTADGRVRAIRTRINSQNQSDENEYMGRSVKRL